jgi:hypothetical protein
MRGQIIELKRLDVSKRHGFCQTGNAGNGGVRSDVIKILSAVNVRVPAPCMLTSSVLGSARFLDFQVLGNLALDHLALAAPYRCHIDHHRAGHRAKLRGVTR